MQDAYTAAGTKDVATWWKGLSKSQQQYWKGRAEPLKNALDYFNNMGDDIFDYFDSSK